MSIQKRILEYIKSKKAAYVDDIVEHIGLLEGGGITISYRIKRTVKNLEKSGHILTESMGRRRYARLTPSGRQKLRSLGLSGDTNLVSTAWDGKWRMVILDVPESDKEVRNALRYILKKAHFACLKNSVWISPHPFEHMLENMKRDLELDKEMMITVTDYLDPETEARFRETYWKN